MSDTDLRDQPRSWLQALRETIAANLDAFWLVVFLIQAVFSSLFAAFILHAHGIEIALVSLAVTDPSLAAIAAARPLQFYGVPVVVVASALLALREYLSA